MGTNATMILGPNAITLNALTLILTVTLNGGNPGRGQYPLEVLPQGALSGYGPRGKSAGGKSAGTAV